MKKLTFYILFLICFGVHKSFAQGKIILGNESARSDYFYQPVGATPASALTEADYLELIKFFQTKYLVPVMEKTGKPLIIPNEWSNPYFAGFATEKPTFFQVSLWGGTVRAPGANRGILAAILCHEIGHILGGEPRQTIPGAEWSSSEGQSDYFAAKICLPEALRQSPQVLSIREIDAEVKLLCLSHEVCEATAQIGLELVRFFQKYSYREFYPVQIDTPEKATDVLLRNTYPSDQCRLDTYLQGALAQLQKQTEPPKCWFKNE